MDPKYLSFVVLTVVCLCLTCLVTAEDQTDPDPVEVDAEKLDYAKGSLCGYCQYCAFCKLCNDDCPCETSASQPNCKMCKYCKFCYLCKACDAVCQPGGYIDTFTSAIVNAMPSFDKGQVDQDINSVKDWIDVKKEEL